MTIKLVECGYGYKVYRDDTEELIGAISSYLFFQALNIDLTNKECSAIDAEIIKLRRG